MINFNNPISGCKLVIMNSSQKIKAVGLLSGGLDSTLACKIIKDLGIEVLGVNFITGFCTKVNKRKLGRTNSCYRPLRAGFDIGIDVDLIDVADEYLEVVKNPQFGYGQALNPCLDCRIFMVKKAKEYMEERGAHFVVTGEVLGQRPMSQHYKALMTVARESGLENRLVRPLSAKLLPETLPEEKGWIKREELFDLQGRSRKRQIKLAKERGITDWPQPAGGCCFLVESEYAKRVKDLFQYKGKEKVTKRDFDLLKIGRHFRLSSQAKAVIGRDENENAYLEQLRDGEWKITTPHFPCPVTLITPQPDPEDLQLACRLTARYSDGRDEKQVKVQIEKEKKTETLTVKPISLNHQRVKKARI